VIRVANFAKILCMRNVNFFIKRIAKREAKYCHFKGLAQREKTMKQLSLIERPKNPMKNMFYFKLDRRYDDRRL